MTINSIQVMDMEERAEEVYQQGGCKALAGYLRDVLQGIGLAPTIKVEGGYYEVRAGLYTITVLGFGEQVEYDMEYRTNDGITLSLGRVDSIATAVVIATSNLTLEASKPSLFDTYMCKEGSFIDTQETIKL